MTEIQNILLVLLLTFVLIFLFFYPRKRKEMLMKIESPVFDHKKEIPSKYTCDGEDINPPLTFKNIPQNTKSLTLIVDDPDAPKGIWTHWLLWNINSETKEIRENVLPHGAIQGKQSWGKAGYGGPCPPSGTHRYSFKLYALDTKLDLPPEADKAQLERAMEGHILANAELIGLYSRQKQKEKPKAAAAS